MHPSLFQWNELCSAILFGGFAAGRTRGNTMALPIIYFTAVAIIMVGWLCILTQAVITVGSWVLS